MAAYFVLAAAVFPNMYEDTAVNVPRPRIDVETPQNTVLLGQSFDVILRSYNDGDAADLQLVSVAFPKSRDLDGIRIVSYDFLQSPAMIGIGDEMGSQYAAGAVTVRAQYPSIEAYSRPSNPGDTFTMTLQITPKEAGQFHIYAKSVAMPHVTNASHFPPSGTLDHQNEFVTGYIIEVVEP